MIDHPGDAANEAIETSAGVADVGPGDETVTGAEAPPTGPESAPPGSVGRQLIASVIAPGSAAVRRAPWFGAVALLVGCGLPIALLAWAYTRRDDPIGFALDQRLLVIVIVVVLAAVAARAAAVAEVARFHRAAPGVRAKTAVAGVAVVALAIPALAIAYQANETRETVGEVFSKGDGEALFDPGAVEPFRPEPVDDGASEGGSESGDAGEDSSGDGDAVDGETVEGAGGQDGDAAADEPAEQRAEGRDVVHTTLLLGSDAGPRRWGARTDSMILVSVHEASGRIALVSIPRNLMRLHFPPDTPLGDIFPNGFNDLANAVFTYVSTRPELVEAYGADGRQPEVVALSQGIGYSFDVRIDDFVLVNMGGFRDIIDAVGGVTVHLDKEVLLQRHNPNALHELPESLGPGRVEMDGTEAIAFARARRGDSDYQRMGRQRQLLSALGSQVSTADAIRAFPRISDVLGDAMRTSLSADEFSDLLDFLGDNAKVGESVGLTPPLITPSRPDFAFMQSIIAAVQHYVRTGEPSGYDT